MKTLTGLERNSAVSRREKNKRVPPKTLKANTEKQLNLEKGSVLTIVWIVADVSRGVRGNNDGQHDEAEHEQEDDQV